MSGPELVVGAVVVDDERLLLIRRTNEPHRDQWAVPGGRVESGETVHEAVTRELREETGLEGACGRLIGWAEALPEETGGRHLVILDFEVTLFESGDPVAGFDAAEARWVYLGDVAELPLAAGLAEFLHEHAIITTII